MANSNNGIIAGKLRGTLGKELVFREWEGKTVVAKAPKKRTGPDTAAQLKIQENFLMATKFASSVMEGKDQGIKDAYNAARKLRQNLFSRAAADFMSPPVVKEIDTNGYTGVVGSTIRIRAIDDFRVTGVLVAIVAASGTPLEKGNAVQQTNGLDWTYTTTQANAVLAGSKISAIATDVPGNTGTLVVTL
ncbi:MAG TPA: hypothetical protein VII28_14150 [Puia sp.]